MSLSGAYCNSSLTATCKLAVALCSSNSVAWKSTCCGGASASVALPTKRYFRASTSRRYTASLDLNALSSVGSSCCRCHSHSNSPL